MWDGDTHSPLLSAIQGVNSSEQEIDDEKNMVEVLYFLLENGADPNYWYWRRDGADGFDVYPFYLTSDLFSLFCKMKDVKLRQELLKNFVDYGLNVIPR